MKTWARFDTKLHTVLTWIWYTSKWLVTWRGYFDEKDPGSHRVKGWAGPKTPRKLNKCLVLENRSVRNQQPELRYVWILELYWLPYTWFASTSETSVNIYQTTRQNNPADNHLHTHRSDSLNCKALEFINFRRKTSQHGFIIIIYYFSVRQRELETR
jgi:hypothetical protein